MNELIPISTFSDVYDGPHATPKRVKSGPVYLGIKAISADGKLMENEFTHLSEEDYLIWTKRVTPNEGDIVFSYEATLGRYAIIPKDFRGSLGRRLAIVRVKDDMVNPMWLYYFFRSKEWTRFIENHTIVGSTVNRISIDEFPTYKVPIPSRTTQDSTVRILKAIDQKIDLNNKTNQKLEKLARSVYNYWFVQYDFPTSDDKPYRSSGNRMVDDTLLGRSIPHGWGSDSVGNLIKLQAGVSYSSDEIASGDGVPMINLGSIDKNREYRDDKLKFYSGKVNESKSVLPGDMLLACTDLTSEGVIIGCPIFTPGHYEKFTYSMDLSKINIVSNKILPTYLYMTLRTDWYHKYIKRFASGTNVRHLDTKGVMRYGVELPPLELQQRFESIVRPMFEKINDTLIENQELVNLRDWLLPLLISGQVQVSDDL